MANLDFRNLSDQILIWNSTPFILLLIPLLLFNCGSSSPDIYYYNEGTNEFFNSGRTVDEIANNAKKCMEYQSYDSFQNKLIIGKSLILGPIELGSPGRFEIQFVRYPDLNGLLIRSITFSPSRRKQLTGFGTMTPQETTYYCPFENINLIYNDLSTKLMGNILNGYQDGVYSAWAADASEEPIIYEDPYIILPESQKRLETGQAEERETERRVAPEQTRTAADQARERARRANAENN